MKELIAGIAVISWLSVFTLSWMMILSENYRNGISITFWVIFVVIAFVATVQWEPKK